MDIYGEIQEALSHQRYTIVVHDLGSKWPEVKMSKEVLTQDVAECMKDLFYEMGISGFDNNGQWATVPVVRVRAMATGTRHWTRPHTSLPSATKWRGRMIQPGT